MNMSRLEPYLGVLAAFTIVFLVAQLPDSQWKSTVSDETAASSSISIYTPVALPAIPLVSTSSLAVMKEKKIPAINSKTKQPAIKVTPAPTPAEPSYTVADFDASSAALRSAIVNIVCYAPAGGPLRSISGSGVIIDPKGIILTNAHIAQYFLLADRGVSCYVRTGAPATSRYEAALMYIPRSWLIANAKVLTTQNPVGTGELDFALLAVTKSVTRDPLPESYPFVQLAFMPPKAGTLVTIASYGAQFLAGAQVQSALSPTVVFGSVKEIYTFASTTIDVLNLGGSAAAQEGSSGGGVSGGAGTLLGLITTSTTEGDTSTRSLDAITSSYVRTAYARETGMSLDTLFARSVDIVVADFAIEIPALESILTALLP